LPATGSPVAHKGRYFVKRAEKRLRLVGAGEVWMWGGDACVAPVPVHPAPSPLPATGSPVAPCIIPPGTLLEWTRWRSGWVFWCASCSPRNFGETRKTRMEEVKRYCNIKEKSKEGVLKSLLDCWVLSRMTKVNM